MRPNRSTLALWVTAVLWSLTVPPALPAVSSSLTSPAETPVHSSGVPGDQETAFQGLQRPVVFEPLPDGGFVARLPAGDLRLDGSGDLVLGHHDGRRVRLSLIDASRPTLQGLDAQGHANYFLGNEPERWRTGVPLYSRVQFAGVYPGIDLVYHDRGGLLEHDFHVHPGVSPDRIRIRIDGVDGAEPRLDAMGNLEAGGFTLSAPEIYQRVDGRRVPVEGRFRLFSDRRFGFEVGAYDPDRELVIDPVLIYSTFYGGPSGERAEGVRLDAAGNIYVAGGGFSGFPTTAGAFQEDYQGTWDMVVLKLSPDGSQVLYATYVGGSHFEGDVGLAVDDAGHAWVSARTFSTDFPLVNPTQATHGGGSVDLVVAKLAPDGSDLLFSTYLGGSNDDWNVWNNIEVDASGRAYVVGQTRSSDFPVVDAVQPTFSPGDCVNTAGDPVICRDVTLSVYASDGSSLVYSTYWGGSGDDFFPRAAITDDGHAILSGTTNSEEFPVVASPLTGGDENNLFVSKLPTDGSPPVFSALIDGADTTLTDLAIAPNGNVLLGGYTASENFPVHRPVQAQLVGSTDGFLLELSPTGVEILFSTYLGGSEVDIPTRLDLDPLGNVTLGGYSWSPDFPLAGPKPDPVLSDGLIARIHHTGPTLLGSAYHGGLAADFGHGVAVSPDGDAFLVGSTDSEDLPLIDPVQSDYGGHSHRQDVAEFFIARFVDGFVTLSTPSRIPAVSGSEVTVPIQVTPGGFDLASGVFSLDYDETCLAFDPTDGDADGVPDTILFNLPATWTTVVTPGAGEITFVIYEPAPPFTPLSLGSLAEVRFDVTCDPGPVATEVPVDFGTAPAPSFGDVTAQSVPVQALDGSVRVVGGTTGDCNGDGIIDAADLTACVLETFDADGTFWLETPGSTFAGNPVGCDANKDTRVDAGDLACKILLVQGLACESPFSLGGTFAQMSLPDLGTLDPGDVVDLPIHLDTDGAMRSVLLSLDLPEQVLGFDSEDQDGDGLPDGLSVQVPNVEAFADWDANRHLGELQVVIYTLAPDETIPVGDLVALRVEVLANAPGGSSSIRFGGAPVPSIGAMDGGAVVPTLSEGVVTVSGLLFEDGFESGDASAWSVIVP